MNVPLLDLRAQFSTLRDEVRAALEEVCESQNFILGPKVAALELGRHKKVERPEKRRGIIPV